MVADSEPATKTEVKGEVEGTSAATEVCICVLVRASPFGGGPQLGVSVSYTTFWLCIECTMWDVVLRWGSMYDVSCQRHSFT